MEVIVEEITIVKVSRETLMETALEEVISKVIDLIINIIHHHYSLNKRSAIYIKSLNTS
jgi:CO dehydrogenase/acetyl-CoA synthase beta subunit